MGDCGKKVACCGGVCFCILVLSISITLIATSIKGLSATTVGLDVAEASRTLNRGQLFKQGTHTLGPFHYFITFPTEQQSISFSSGSDI